MSGRVGQEFRQRDTPFADDHRACFREFSGKHFKSFRCGEFRSTFYLDGENFPAIGENEVDFVGAFPPVINAAILRNGID